MTKKTAPNKTATEGAWVADTKDEFAVKGTAAVWRTQISTAPDGRRFAGIRKYFVRKDGTERADRAGLSIMIDPENPTQSAEMVAKLGELLTNLAAFDFGSATKAKKPTKVSAKAAEKAELDMPRVRKATVPENEAPRWVLFDPVKSRYLTHFKRDPETKKAAIATSNNPDSAKCWGARAEAIEYRDGRSALAGFKVKTI